MHLEKQTILDYQLKPERQSAPSASVVAVSVKEPGKRKFSKKKQKDQKEFRKRSQKELN